MIYFECGAFDLYGFQDAKCICKTTIALLIVRRGSLNLTSDVNVTKSAGLHHGNHACNEHVTMQEVKDEPKSGSRAHDNFSYYLTKCLDISKLVSS